MSRPIRGAALAVLATACLAAGCGSSEPSPSTSSASPVVRKPTPAPRQVARVKVPDIVGEKFGQAIRDVERAGLEQTAPHFTGTIGNPHYSGHCKKILNQSPPPGTRVPEGYTVSIVYGVCPKAIANAHRSLKPRGG